MVPVLVKTLSDVNNLIIPGKTDESVFLDFKAKLNVDKEAWHIEAACDICQFANAWGGCLLFGISEIANPENGRKVAGDFIGIKNVEELKQRLNNAVRDKIFSDIADFETIPINFGELTVVSVIVQPIETGLAFVKNDPNSFLVPYRTEYGKRFMTPDMIEQRISLNRSVMLKLNRYWPQKRRLQIITPVYMETLSKDFNTKVNPFEWHEFHPFSHNFELNDLLSDSVIVKYNSRLLSMSYNLIRAVWETQDNRIGMAIEGKIIVNDQEGVESIRVAID